MYLFDADELDRLRSSLELPFRKLEVLEPTYLEGVTRLLSEKRKKVMYLRKICKIPKILAKYHTASLSNRVKCTTVNFFYDQRMKIFHCCFTM